MRIEWAIPCRYCETEGNTVHIVGGNADAFTVPQLPWEIGVWIALEIVATEDEAGPEITHSFRGRVLDPQMEEIPGTALEIPEFHIAEPPLEGWEARETVPSYHLFVAEEGGAYTLELRVDERAKTVPIHVLLPDEPSEA